ncbi:hypothetical protein D3C72_2168920 [compost metagenome]
MQHQFITAGDPGTEKAAKVRVGFEIVVLVKVRHHQPGHWHATQRIDGFDEGLIVRPGWRSDVMQHQ